VGGVFSRPALGGRTGSHESTLFEWERFHRLGAVFPEPGTFLIFPIWFLGSLRRARKERRWSADDLAKLKNMAQKFPAAHIAAELGRGLSATMVKAHQLRVSLSVSLRMKKKKASDFASADTSADQSTGAAR
jgi:hypothetical protein